MIAAVLVTAVALGACAEPLSRILFPGKTTAELAASAALRIQADVRQWVFDAMAPANAATRERLQGQVEAMAGREDMRSPGSRAVPACTPLPDDPLELIAREARKTSIVIISESHSEPQHRHFIGEVLRVLRQQDFAIYAAETFTDAPLDRADASAGDGWYSNEPIFGRTVSAARALGYRLVGYEQTEAQDKERAAAAPDESVVNRREWAQTRNLMDRIFARAPEAKVVIHVGGQHGEERGRPDGQSRDQWMAERLKVATGIDPLTIRQATCNSPNRGSVVSRERPGGEATSAGWSPVDLHVGHSPRSIRNGRPAWRQETGDQVVEMPRIFLEVAEPLMVEARAAAHDEILATVPLDRVLLFPGEDLPLLLPPGKYRLDAFTRGGRLAVDPVNIEVR